MITVEAFSSSHVSLFLFYQNATRQNEQNEELKIKLQEKSKSIKYRIVMKNNYYNLRCGNETNENPHFRFRKTIIF